MHVLSHFQSLGPAHWLRTTDVSGIDYHEKVGEQIKLFSFWWKIIDIFIWITEKITLQMHDKKFWIHVDFKNVWLHNSIYFTEAQPVSEKLNQQV